MKNRISKKPIFILLGFFLLLLPAKNTLAEDATAAPNIYIENTSLEGQTESEINSTIQVLLNKIRSHTITVYVGNQSLTITPGDLGVEQRDMNLAKKIIDITESGNVWQRMKARNYVTYIKPLYMPLELTYSNESIANAVKEKFSALNIKRQDLGIQRDANGVFGFTEKVDGLMVEEDETITAFTDFLYNDYHGGTAAFNAVTQVDKAQGNWDSTLDINSILGQATTAYAVDEANANRNKNLEIATEKINGMTLFPGQEFSAEEVLAPFTTEAGYQEANIIQNGKIVSDIGGGICQISSTLYRAVLESEMEVTQRNEHSMIVGYVEPSMDASVGGGKDFKFVNNTDAPIYIEGVTGNGSVHFAIYGHETRSATRTIAFESKVESKEEVVLKVTLDPNKPYKEMEVVQGHPAMKASAYKIIYENQVEIKREKISDSVYKPGDQEFIVGTQGADEGQLSMLNNLAQSKDVNGIITLIEWKGTF